LDEHLKLINQDLAVFLLGLYSGMRIENVHKKKDRMKPCAIKVSVYLQEDSTSQCLSTILPGSKQHYLHP
jgi:hypothetical protein